MTSLPAIRPTKILDQFGKPASFSRLYQNPRSNPRQYKPRARLSMDTRSNVSSYDRLDLVDYSQQMFAQVDALSTAIKQKNTWAFGDSWEPHYIGDSYKWVEEASEFLLRQFYPFCNIRGPQFDMRTSMKLMGQGWDVFGDDLLVLTETESHFPQIAMFPSTRIGSWGDNGSIRRQNTEIKGVTGFDGAKLVDGMILNRDNRIIGVALIQDDGTTAYLPSINANVEFEPDWNDQVRGIPRIATSLLRWLNIYEIDERIQAAVKRACGLSFKVKNAEGEAPIGNEAITGEESPSASDTSANIVGGADGRNLHYEEVSASGGEIWWLDATQGEDIEEVKFSNPHPNIEAYIARLQQDALSSVGWDYALLHANQGGRAPTRLVCELANNAIWDRQATGVRRWRRIITYALAKAAKHGFISKPKSPLDYTLWMPGLPKEMSVDAGNDAKMGIDRIKFGISTVGIETSKLGYHPDFIAREQFKDLSRVVDMANRLYPMVKANGISYETCLQMCRQTSPNPPMNQNANNAPTNAGDQSS